MARHQDRNQPKGLFVGRVGIVERDQKADGLVAEIAYAAEQWQDLPGDGADVMDRLNYINGVPYPPKAPKKTKRRKKGKE